MIILFLIVAMAIAIFYLVLNAQELPGTWKFIIIAIEMLIVSQIFIRRYKLSSELGLVLIKSKKSLDTIDNLAKRKEIFNFLADIGNSIAYGLLSLVIMKKHTAIKTLVCGLILLGLLTFLVGPTAFVFLFQVLHVGSVDKTTISTMSQDTDIGLYVIAGILLVGGLFLFILFGILFYGAVIIMDIFSTVTQGTAFTTEPGGTFLLPGINLPFFEGILALIVVLVVHESAHAVLTRIAKIRLLSSGIVLFGIIPMGAFVEPDEHELGKLDDVRQTRVLIAGSTSNLMTSIIFFILFVGFVLIVNASGIGPVEYTTTLGIGEYTFDLVLAPIKFIYMTLGLIFALNFIVGAINLLPLPLFDGYRIIDVNMKNKYIVKGLMYITLAFFILNFVPWFLK